MLGMSPMHACILGSLPFALFCTLAPSYTPYPMKRPSPSSRSRVPQFLYLFIYYNHHGVYFLGAVVGFQRVFHVLQGLSFATLFPFYIASFLDNCYAWALWHGWQRRPYFLERLFLFLYYLRRNGM